MQMYELPTAPLGDSQASFGGKAKVAVSDTQTSLFSYDTEVAVVEGTELRLLSQSDSSQTTKRHVRAFARAYGVDVGKYTAGDTFEIAETPNWDSLTA